MLRKRTFLHREIVMSPRPGGLADPQVVVSEIGVGLPPGTKYQRKHKVKEKEVLLWIW